MSECAGKQALASPQAAQRVQQARKNLHATKVYHCRQCGHYHLGSEFWPRKYKAATAKRRAHRDNGSSGLLGVTWNRQHKRWQAKIQSNKKRHHVGYFDDPMVASAAYEAAKAALHIGGCHH